MLTYILFVPGFVLLLAGGSFLVDGASAVARRLRVSDIVIGLTIVAFGTSAPELIVSIFAAARGNTEIAIGNALGSNTMNIFLILGVSAMIYPLTIGRGTTWKEIPFSLLAVGIVWLLGSDVLVGGGPSPALGRIDGGVLIAGLALFLAYVLRVARKDRSALPVEVKTAAMRMPKACVLVVLGIVGLNFGADWVVNGAVQIAKLLGVSESVIALTVVSVGTSLPELATSAIAARKRNADIAVGNVVGSNIFNMFWVLGVAAVIRPLPFQAASNVDAGVAALGSALLFVWVFVGFRRHALERYEGVIFVVLYAAYLVYLVAFRQALFAGA